MKPFDSRICLLGGSWPLLLAFAFSSSTSLILPSMQAQTTRAQNSRAEQPGSIEGSVINSETGRAAPGIKATIRETGASVVSDKLGRYEFSSVAPGTYSISLTGDGYQAKRIVDVVVRPSRAISLGVEEVPALSIGEPVQLDEIKVSAKDGGDVISMDSFEVRDRRAELVAGGNLDLVRTQDDALPYQVFGRTEIARSGAIDLNTFLQQNLLSADATTIPSEITPNGDGTVLGSNNLNMRGYGADQTVILVNGRRMPNSQSALTTQAPNVNSIPLGLIERVEVLSESASSIYGVNAIGGVINIVLKPHAQVTEVVTSYNNATAGFDAPQTSVALYHGQTLLNGRLSFRVGVYQNNVVPPTEAELGFQKIERARDQARAPTILTAPILGATPNIRSTTAGVGLFGPGTSSVTSVAPGANGLGGLAAFAGREGLRNFDLYDTPGGFSSTLNSVDTAYGKIRDFTSYSGSVQYRPFDWLEVSLDGTYSQNNEHIGYSLPNHSVNLPANSPFNPFGIPVSVAFQETHLLYGEDYRGGFTDTWNYSGGLLVKLPRGFRLTADAQRTESITRLRFLVHDLARVDALIRDGLLNPFRDTQVFPAPREYYDRGLYYRFQGGKHGSKHMFSTDEYTVRLTNQSLSLPTGRGTLVVGSNYLRRDVESYAYENRWGDGSFRDIVTGRGRTRYDWGVFGELQAPVIPERWLPRGIKAVEGDVAYRYSGSDTYDGGNHRPTFALKVDLPAGFSVRGTYSEAFLPPTPTQALGTGDEVPAQAQVAADPRRPGDSSYTVAFLNAPTPTLVPEEATTQTLGVIFKRGRVHQLRVSLDYTVTEKINEITPVTTAASVLALEQYYPDRVQREAASAPFSVGRATFIRGGFINVYGRDSKNWDATLRHVWTEAFGGTLDTYVRGFYFESFKTQVLPTAPVVESIENPDTGVLTFLHKYRTTFGTNWSTRNLTFGTDGRFYYPRVIQRSNFAGQGSDRVKRYWEFDAYVGGELARFLPWKNRRYGLRAQLRVNNIFDKDLPFFFQGVGDVQPYGDYRGRTYTLSLTASY